MQNQKDSGQAQTGQNKQTKPIKKKKNGKIQQVWTLSQKGVSVKEIAQKMKISEKIVRSYIWRAKNPEKFKALLKRYRENRKKKADGQKQPEPDPEKKPDSEVKT